MIDYRIGDTRDVIASIPDGSVSLVACSPPFIALRSYLPADHPDKHREIGSEPDPATFLDTLLALTAEWGRVLAPWGSIAIELGDTYAGSGGGGGDYLDGGMRAGQQQFAGSAASMRESNAAHWRAKNQAKSAWPLPKCLALAPQAYALSLAYGRNVLNGNPSPAGQWLVRNMIVWHRPNPAVGALGDKFRPSTSYIIVATRSPKRWFDLTAVRTAPTADPAKYDGNGYGYRSPKEKGNATVAMPGNAAGAPPLDCWDDHETWTITTQPSKLAHYAMWPPRLAERLVLSMCPEWVCNTCNKPRRRIEVETSTRVASETDAGKDRIQGRSIGGAFVKAHLVKNAERATAGWIDCGCGDTWTPGVVLDPFAGTGTTLAVADLHGRDSIGIDIDARNRDLLPARINEVRKSLTGMRPPMEGQMAIDFGVSP